MGPCQSVSGNKIESGETGRRIIGVGIFCVSKVHNVPMARERLRTSQIL